MRQLRFRIGWAAGPYIQVEHGDSGWRSSTVVSVARLVGRQFGKRTWVVPHLYRSNAQVRFEWGLVEVHHIR